MDTNLQKTNRIIDSLSGIRYDLGCNDCLFMINKYLEDSYGFKKPNEFRELSLENYADRYLDNNKKAMEILSEYLSAYMIKTDKNFVFVGDVLHLEINTKKVVEDKIQPHKIAIGVLSSPGKALMCTVEEGTSIRPLDNYVLINAYRGIK